MDGIIGRVGGGGYTRTVELMILVESNMSGDCRGDEG